MSPSSTTRFSYSHKVCFADRSISIQTDQLDGKRLIDHIFADIANDPLPAAHCRFTVSRSGSLWRLQQCLLDGGQEAEQPDADRHGRENEAVTLYKGDSLGDLSSILVGEVIYHLTDRCDSGLVLHAAAVARDGVCVALPAASGSGKTTLCAWLVSQGWHYLTDELIHIPLDAMGINCFTRPFNFKKPAYSLIESEFGLRTDADYAMTGSFASLIAHRQLRAWAPVPLPELTHLVFPRYDASHSGVLTELSSARAGLALMECLVNARNLPQHGFDEVSRIVRNLKSYSFEYSSFASAHAKLTPVLTAEKP